MNLEQAFYNLVQDVPHLVTFLVVGSGAVWAVARAVHRRTPKGPTTEYVNLEDLMNEKWTSTAAGELGLVAGACFSASNDVRCVSIKDPRGCEI